MPRDGKEERFALAAEIAEHMDEPGMSLEVHIFVEDPKAGHLHGHATEQDCFCAPEVRKDDEGHTLVVHNGIQ